MLWLLTLVLALKTFLPMEEQQHTHTQVLSAAFSAAHPVTPTVVSAAARRVSQGRSDRLGGAGGLGGD